MLLASISSFAEVGTTMQKIKFIKPIIEKELPGDCKLIEESLNIESTAFDVMITIVENFLPGEADHHYAEFLCKFSNDVIKKGWVYFRTESAFDRSKYDYSNFHEKYDPINEESFKIYTLKKINLHLI